MMLADALALLGVVIGVVLVAANWSQLPDRIPHHFNLHGEPDRWGSKAMLLLLPALAALLFAGLTIANRFPHKFNYLWPITAENAERQYCLARTMMCFLKAEVIWLLTYLTWQAIRVGAGEADMLNRVPLFGVLLLVLLTLIVYLVRARSIR
jgi:uncharacterized membrane protein